jgi:molybdate transport system ATP-binding protein
MAAPLLTDFERAFPAGPRVACDLAVGPEGGPVTVLFGPSGAGKTTILRCLAGLERPDRGTIRFGDEVWFDAAAGTMLAPQRRRVGLCFQGYALFPHLTVEGNVGFGLAGLDRAPARARVATMLRTFQLDGLATRRAADLSGGERQRVALARALAPEPRLLLLDEPLSALDLPLRETLRGELRRLLAGLAIPTVLVTHDRVDALALGDRLAVLSDGRVRQVGPIEDVFSRPADVAVARVVGVETVVAAHVVERPSEGLVVVQAGAARLSALDPGGGVTEVFACIRAEEVILEPGPGGPTSARNRLAGHVIGVQPEGPLVRVEVDCGLRLTALVTRQSCAELGLEAGVATTAVIKVPAVHLVPRGR